ncbi:MAG: nucleotide exchange factor GrpE [Gammaproteobacteria bacterium]|jgi:molecular chaperone GrpE|nr:nucleotide exchange factor GrpE [Gammaproteobacteria bacterium]
MTETKQKPEDNSLSAEEATSTDDTTDIDQQVEQERFTQELEEAQQQASDYHEKMLRMQAEMENLRKRSERDLSNAHKYSIEKFASELLQVKDSLELGLGTGDVDAVNLQEGAELTLKMMASVLKKFTIEEIDPCGEIFDPNLHQAMTMQASVEHEPNTVITVMQKGYTLHGRLLRPAMVIVAKAPEEVADE